MKPSIRAQRKPQSPEKHDRTGPNEATQNFPEEKSVPTYRAFVYGAIK